MHGPKRSEWRVIREFRDDVNFYVIGVSKRRRGEYSIRLSRWVERDFAEHLMPHLHIHVQDGVVPPFHDEVSSLLDRAHKFISDDVERDQQRIARSRDNDRPQRREYY